MDGVAFTDEELELGMRSMAVAVRDSRGNLRAAMSVSTAAARLSMAELRQNSLPVLQERAQQFGQTH